MRITGFGIFCVLIIGTTLPSAAEIYSKELSPTGLQNECSQRCREDLVKVHGKGETSIEGTLKKEMSDYSLNRQSRNQAGKTTN